MTAIDTPATTTTTIPAATNAIILTTQLIDTWPAAREACVRLRKHKLLALDMEGAPLATCTSLLQLAVSSQEVYVFDVQSLGQGLFDAEHLLPILSDPCILKLCYDCRGDGCALYNQHGVRAYGLYDIQIVYASLRARAPALLVNDEIPTTAAAAAPPPAAAATRPNDAFLKGLQCAVAHIVPPDTARAFAQRKREWKTRWRRQEQQNQSNGTNEHFLLQRPLPDDALLYASADVEHLFALHRAWHTYFSTNAVVAASDARMCAAMKDPPAACDSDGDDFITQQRLLSSLQKALIDFPLLPPLTVRPRRLLFRYPFHHGGSSSATSASSVTPRRALSASHI